MQIIITVEENHIKTFSLKENKLKETYPNTEKIIQIVVNTKSDNYLGLVDSKTIKVCWSTKLKTVIILFGSCFQQCKFCLGTKQRISSHCHNLFQKWNFLVSYDFLVE